MTSAMLALPLLVAAVANVAAPGVCTVEAAPMYSPGVLASAGSAHAGITVRVGVHVDDLGKPSHPIVLRSSGNAVIDAEAVKSSMQTPYAPKRVNCDAVPGEATFDATFVPDDPVAAQRLAAATAPAQAPSPTVSPVAVQPCYREISTVALDQEPYLSAGVPRNFGPVDVHVDVRIEADGSVSFASIAASSGNMFLDQAALHAARKTTYAPKIINCMAVPATYHFVERFAP